MQNRIIAEQKTIRAMLMLYCRNKHKTKKELCENCTKILNYANYRIIKCPMHPLKPKCSDCTVHCYKSEYRNKIIEIMKYSGPRMILFHPILTIKHLYNNKIYGIK